MNSNTGFFEKEEERIENWMQTIEVGETVKIKGEELEVESIDGRKITLKLLSLEDRAFSELKAQTNIEDFRKQLLAGQK